MWQYRSMKLGGSFSGTPSDKAIAELNRLSAEGWEVVDFASITFGPYVALLKRRAE